MKLTIVTTTRDRPLCFSLLEKWVASQTRQPDEWLVINDSERPNEYRYSLGQKVIVRTDEGLSQELRSLPSICKNWLEAIKHLGGTDRVAVFEDDDYYDPAYLETVNRMLDEVDLAGVSHDVYWKFKTRRFVRMGNENHASLAASGWRSGLNPQVERICQLHCRDNPFIDCYLWAEVGPVWPGRKKLLRQPVERGRMLHVGMKLMPGCPGLGVGHLNPESGSTDPNFAVLQEWIGPEAANVYRRVWVDHFGSTART